jgi:dUTP pyrophosphatase
MNIVSAVENIPTRATPGSAGLDLRTPCEIELQPNSSVLVDLGVSVAIPDGFVGLLLPRSSLWHRHALMLGNSVGIIDSDYRGPLCVRLFRPFTHDLYDPVVPAGTRIAQLVLVPVSCPAVTLVTSLDETERGSGGFGSTG